MGYKPAGLQFFPAACKNAAVCERGLKRGVWTTSPKGSHYPDIWPGMSGAGVHAYQHVTQLKVESS